MAPSRFINRFISEETTMKIFAMCCVAAALALPAVSFAAGDQQNKMTACNQQAGAMKGDERKKFMSSCLKKDSGSGTAQQNKMKHCNEAAAGKAGDERKAFMSSCLKKSG
jgi:uncharacterized protein HemX